MPSGVKRTHEQFVSELAQVNSCIVPLSIYKNNRTTMRFKCTTCNTEWSASPARIIRSGYCPHCSKQAQAKRKTKSHESFVSEVKKESPDTLVIGTYINSKTRIRCKCKNCGHEWSPFPSTLLNGGGCPKCSYEARAQKRYKSNDKFLVQLQEIAPLILPLEEYKGSNNPIKVKCMECGHTWRARPDRLLIGRGCPFCHRHNQTSYLEQFVLNALKCALGDNQVLARDKSAIGLELDIYIPNAKLAIEPGSWHWHGNETAKKRDVRKRKLCREAGIRILFIFTDYPCKQPPFKRDCIVYRDDLGKKADVAALVSLVKMILDNLNVHHDFSSQEIEAINLAAIEATRHIRPEEFKERIERRNKQIEVLGSYSNAVTSIECRCRVCGHIWSPLPYNLHMGKGCPKCAYEKRGKKKRLTNETFLERVSECNPNIQVLSQYNKSDEKVSCKCLICDHEWEVRASNLLRGIGCPNCARIVSAKRRMRAVICIETDEKFESVKSAANHIKKSTSAIASSIRKGTKCGGYHWRYID